MGKIKKEELFSIPNCMGYFRILLIPFFCGIYLKADSMKDYYLAAGIVIISTITDFLDGKVARKFHMITEFGKFLDPLADKLTHGAIALCLAFRYEAMRYLVALMLVKEGFMAIMGLINLCHGKKLDGAKWFGKVCTASLFVVLCILVLFPGIPLGAAETLIYLEIGIMEVTLLLYIPEFRKMRKSWEQEESRC
ncbi:MAG TPA: CDP-alcohol phosphatidyltransferase family protein [Candidatus Blautia stercoravium]|nr:CDP-alcohol phosphatidyltransferase family protein [Candidatus Blautia stercoravium]